MDGGGAAAVQVLVQNLIDVTMGEISLIRGLKKNSHKLHNSSTLIHNYLDDAEKKMTTDDAVKTWLKQLEDVGFDARNVLDELIYHDISKKMKKIRREKKKKVLPSCFPSFNDYVPRRPMALRINEIYIRFESSLDHATKLGLHSQPAIEYALPLVTDPDTLDPICIGRDKDVAYIVGKMLAHEEPFFVLPIVGMGGLGKTTLTRKIFNHERIKTHFGKQMWVHVSRDFDVVVVLRNMLENLTSERVVDVSRVVLLKNLREELKNKTYLLVLDDVWNEDVRMWENFENSLSRITSTMGNYILVTTRSKGVASIVHTHDIHYLNVLSNEDCLSIIKQKALNKTEDHIPSGFESIANNIVKRCQGLPLAANVAGGLLHRTPKDKWISIANGWLSNLQVDDNDILKTLRLSFDHLSPPSLKRCFAYCSIFPKDEVIDKQQLIELWMAQGFLQIDPKKGMEVEGNKFFNSLVQNSLLLVVERDEYANITHCSMHDLVHDLACIVSKGDYQVQCIGSQNGDDVSSSIPIECWRTLFYKSEILSDTIFSNFKSLYILTLMDCDLTELPSSINELLHLRYLQISSSRIQDFPDSIGDLYHLQTLRADNDKIRKLPTTVQYLINLRHLHLSYVTELPPNIGSLTCLQTLEYYHVGKEEGHRIGELGKLKDLQGKLHISNLEKVYDRKEAESAHLFEKTEIFNLVLQWSMSRVGETNHVNVLEGLRPHPNLKRLEIIRFKGRKFPSNMVEGLYNLMEVSLKDCNECKEIPMMGHLPHLKSLSLFRLRQVKSIRSSFKDRCKERIVVFPELQRLELSEMPKLVEWIEIELAENEYPLEIKVFPCLEHLDINNCKNLRMDPSQFSSRHKELNNGLHICGSLTKLRIGHLDDLPDWFLNNQNLLDLYISNCGKLRELPHGLETLNSLKKLVIEECPNLKSIAYRSMENPNMVEDIDPSQISSFPSNMVEGINNLMEVSLIDCNECEEIPMMGHLPHLKSLSLSRLRKVKSIHSSFKDSSYKEKIVVFPVLERLKLSEMPKLVEWIEIELAENEHPLEIKVFPCLEQLKISECRELRMDPSQLISSCRKELNHGLHICGSLTHLEISGLDEVEYLPNGFLSNQNLLKLEISSCPKLRELPDGLHTLNSPKELYIERCPNLKSIAYRSDGESQGLTSLESLSILNCKGLISLRCEMLESCAPSLLNLRLWDLSSLINLPVIIDSLPKMSSLKSLKIGNVPKLISPPAPVVFDNLQILKMKPYDSDSSDSAKKGVDGMLQAASHSLQRLWLEGMEDWDSLPHSLQHLNALSKLYLKNFRMEELPKWFGNLTSLQRLKLQDCKELRSVEVTRCLKKLTQLWIFDCPILQSCIAQQIEDVSHIPNIWVDFQVFRKDGRQVGVLW